MTTDLSVFAFDLATETKAFVAEELAKHVSALVERCVALEREVFELKAQKAIPGPAGESVVGPQGEPGPAGTNGKDADLSLLMELTADVAALQGQWSAFKEWQSNHQETKAAPAPVVDESAIVARVIAAIPVPKDGKDGRDGIDGKDGVPGPQGPQGMTGGMGPVGEKGLDGTPGRDGRDGLPGVPGPMGEKGLDGKDGRDGIDGKDGADGLHGKDGFGFDDIGVIFDQEQGYALRFSRGEDKQDFPLGFVWDAGTYQLGRLYPKGAAVTDRGAYWVAQMATKERPPKLGEPRLQSCPWRLAVKPGRDGKDAEPRKDGV